MANALFGSYRNLVLGAGLNLGTLSIEAMFVDHTDFTPDPTNLAHDFISDVTSAGRIPAFGSTPVLGSKTLGSVAVGVFDAADTVFTALTGDQAESLILFEDSGTDTTSDLLAFWDTATGLPLTPNGGDVTVQWNASGIFRY